MKEFPSCRSAFLSLVDAPGNACDYEVETQYVISNGRPDLVLCDKGQGIIMVENKPWDNSFFTYGDQLERYAEHLKTCKFQKKTLCLLATQKNRSRFRLVEEEKNATDGINFVVITWEQVFDKLESACSRTENMVPVFLLKELNAWMFPPVVEIPPEVLQDNRRIWENWVAIKPIVKQARDIAASDLSLSDYMFMTSPGQNQKPTAESMNSFGYYIYDMKSGHCLFFGAHMDARRFLGGQSLFVLQVRKGWENLSGGKSDIDFDALKKCGFTYDEPSRNTSACEFVYPLTDSAVGHNISPDKLADALAEILKKTSEEINKDREAKP
jgi:hypothetical protein